MFSSLSNLYSFWRRSTSDAGESPPEKKQTIDNLKEHKTKTMARINLIKDEESRKLKLRKQIIDVSRSDFVDAKICLNTYNIEFFQSSNEAEATCARLVKEKKATYVLSNDSDTLVFGSSFIFKKKNIFYKIELGQVLKELEMTQDEFICMCVLLGCDYCRSPKKVNVSNVHRLIKDFGDFSTFFESNTRLNVSDEEQTSLKHSVTLFQTLGDYKLAYVSNV